MGIVTSKVRFMAERALAHVGLARYMRCVIASDSTTKHKPDREPECGVLDHGLARVRCGACTHEYLLAFSCKTRYFCPSCHAKRLGLWTLWLEDSLLVSRVPHRQVVLTIPKRLRAWCLYRRTLLGDLARVAARTVTAAVRALTGVPALAVGIVGCIQTHGSLANWHPHIHRIATDSGFRPGCPRLARSGWLAGRSRPRTTEAQGLVM
jgi:hypothetical protein